MNDKQIENEPACSPYACRTCGVCGDCECKDYVSFIGTEEDEDESEEDFDEPVWR